MSFVHIMFKHSMSSTHVIFDCRMAFTQCLFNLRMSYALVILDYHMSFAHTIFDTPCRLHMSFYHSCHIRSPHVIQSSHSIIVYLIWNSMSFNHALSIIKHFSFDVTHNMYHIVKNTIRNGVTLVRKMMRFFQPNYILAKIQMFKSFQLN